MILRLLTHTTMTRALTPSLCDAIIQSGILRRKTLIDAKAYYMPKWMEWKLDGFVENPTC
jgi:hypothetical protein